MNKVELLAPAGNYESLIGALNAGADAVYLGGEKFGARAFAENFTTEQLVQGIKYAHILGKKIFLTINTLVKEKEFSEMYDYVLPFYEAGLDAVIVQDLGVFQFIKTHFPDMEIHVSTQMTITGVYGAKLLKEMGAHRVVPARELSLEEIKDIKTQTGLDIETFVHGAMCYCYSGQCLFSSYLGGRSGNRGKCAQPCRLPYAVKNGQGKGTQPFYPLSLKDMCTIEQLPKLIEAGIDSFKIEGRMKKPEYVAGVTAIYRKYIDMYYENLSSFKVSQKDLQKLRTLYIRSEIQDGYYFRHNGKEMITLDSPSYSGNDEELLATICQTYLEKEAKCQIEMKAVFHLQERALVTVKCGMTEVTVYGEEVLEALKAPVTRDNIEKGLLALGDSFYSCTKFELSMDDNIFYSLKAIKELRRKALAELTELLCKGRQAQEVCQEDQKEASPAYWEKHGIKTESNAESNQAGGYRVLFSTIEQAEGYLQSKMQAAILVFEADLVEEHFEDWLAEFKEKVQKKQPVLLPKILIALPYVLRKRDYKWLTGIMNKIEQADGVLIRNLETLGYLKEIGYTEEIYGDAGFYVWNKQTAEFFVQLDGLCMPLELAGKEQLPLVSTHANFEQLVYGHMPMMVTANCIARTAYECLQTKKEKDREHSWTYSLLDRMNKQLPVYLSCKHCYNVIYNSVVLSLHDKVKNGARTAMRLNLTVESRQESILILNYFAALLDDGDRTNPPYTDYTTGHEKKGAL